jgi:hypothetical protein
MRVLKRGLKILTAINTPSPISKRPNTAEKLPLPMKATPAIMESTAARIQTALINGNFGPQKSDITSGTTTARKMKIEIAIKLFFSVHGSHREGMENKDSLMAPVYLPHRVKNNL